MYTAHIYKGNYIERQRAANQDNCLCYVEHHFNASSHPNADYSVVVVADNASQKSKDWGRWYSREASRIFGTRIGGGDGIMVGGYQGRGNDNLVHTAMPAILLEPLFGSTPEHAEIIRSIEGQQQLARLLVASIWCQFPQGGLVGLSIGHKYKRSNPDDRGAAVLGAPVVEGRPLAEADYAEAVVTIAADLLNHKF